MSERRDAFEVSAEALTARCDPASLPFESTGDLHALEAVFGQERAVRAIEFALGMAARGYNLYASGPDGIGKSSIIETYLQRFAESRPPPPDWVYVHNFEDPDRPGGIALAAGEGRAFAEAMRGAVEHASTELREAFDGDSYIRQRSAVLQEQELRARLDARAAAAAGRATRLRAATDLRRRRLRTDHRGPARERRGGRRAPR